ncbi:hypothetical protein TWF506_011389 [Arthrobotrys conoides]|uniref:RING-type domain-containing protein n=1 Tax=Arthrobotrys conoides TaxID=74498 RepID=A0AAN8NQQ9_9PEZI
MAPRVRPKASISKSTATEIQKKKLEQQISQLAVDLKWAEVIAKTRRSRRLAAKGTGGGFKSWKGHTRASLGTGTYSDILPKPLETYPQEKCITCFTCESNVPAHQTVTLPCGHIHCHDCLLMNYETVIKSPAGFPPRCCEPLDFETTSFCLSSEQIEDFLRVKARHESTRIIPCAYCGEELFDANTVISESAAYCLDCNRLTCTICQKEMHKDVCPQSQGTTELQETATKAKWNQCPRCHCLIEKIGGCNYITCGCGQNFCTKCGEPARLSDGQGCLCIERVQPRRITFGESFQSATEDSLTPMQVNYRNLLRAHKRATLSKQKSFKDLGIVMTAAKEKHEERSKMVEEIAELRAQLAKLKQRTNTKKIAADPEKATAEMDEDAMNIDQSIGDTAMKKIDQSPGRKKRPLRPRKGKKGTQSIQ